MAASIVTVTLYCELLKTKVLDMEKVGGKQCKGTGKLMSTPLRKQSFLKSSKAFMILSLLLKSAPRGWESVRRRYILNLLNLKGTCQDNELRLS